MTIKVSDDKALQALDDFIKSYQSTSEDAGLSRFSLLAADGDADDMAHIDVRPLWQWQNYAQYLQDKSRLRSSMNESEPAIQSIPDDLRKTLTLHLNSLLKSLAIADDYSEMHEDANIVALSYSEHLKTTFINDKFSFYESQIDYHQALISIAKESVVNELQDLLAYDMDDSLAVSILTAAKGLAATACYLLDHYFDYFWSWVAIAKAQRLMGIYIGIKAALDISVTNKRSAGSEAAALNRERIEDCLLKVLIARSRHWVKKIVDPVSGERKTVCNKPTVAGLQVDTTLHHEVARCLSLYYTGKNYQLTDLATKISNLLASSKQIKTFLKEFKDIDAQITTPYYVHDDHSITFGSEEAVKVFIAEQMEGRLLNDATFTDALRVREKLADPKLQESAMFIKSIGQVYQTLINPLHGVIRKTPSK